MSNTTSNNNGSQTIDFDVTSLQNLSLSFKPSKTPIRVVPIINENSIELLYYMGNWNFAIYNTYSNELLLRLSVPKYVNENKIVTQIAVLPDAPQKKEVYNIYKQYHKDVMNLMDNRNKQLKYLRNKYPKLDIYPKKG